MYADERGEPTDEQYLYWNEANDHAEDGDYDDDPGYNMEEAICKKCEGYSPYGEYCPSCRAEGWHLAPERPEQQTPTDTII